MATLGTKNIWQPFASNEERPRQILKNEGYITIALREIHYNAAGNFWQRLFGGHDKLVITSGVVYKVPGQEATEARSVQVTSQVKANVNHFLGGAPGFLALKVPAYADGLEIKTTFTAIKGDHLDRTLELLSGEDFKIPLRADSIAIGQVATVTRMIKNLFSQESSRLELESSFPGVIGSATVEHPVDEGMLTEGFLITLANQDDDNHILEQFDRNKLQYDGQHLLYAGKPFTGTYVVYTIRFDPARGIDEQSKWFHQHQLALSRLDGVLSAIDDQQKKEVLQQALQEMEKGNVLLDADPTYIHREKKEIKARLLLQLREEFKAKDSLGVDDLIASRAMSILEEESAPRGANGIEPGSTSRGLGGLLDADPAAAAMAQLEALAQEHTVMTRETQKTSQGLTASPGFEATTVVEAGTVAADARAAILDFVNSDSHLRILILGNSTTIQTAAADADLVASMPSQITPPGRCLWIKDPATRKDDLLDAIAGLEADFDQAALVFFPVSGNAFRHLLKTSDSLAYTVIEEKFLSSAITEPNHPA